MLNMGLFSDATLRAMVRDCVAVAASDEREADVRKDAERRAEEFSQELRIRGVYADLED